MRDGHQHLFPALFEPGDIVEMRPFGVGVHQRWRTVTSWIAETLSGKHDKADVYFGANPRSSKGGSTADDVDLCRSLVVDIDDHGLSEKAAIARVARLPPVTALAFSGRGWHAWWRLTEAIMPDLWRDMQKGIIAAVEGSDTKIHDPPRIMRWPGTINQKSGERCVLSIIEPSNRYVVDEFIKCSGTSVGTPSRIGVPVLSNTTTDAADAREAREAADSIAAVESGVSVAVLPDQPRMSKGEQQEVVQRILNANPIPQKGRSDLTIHNLALGIKRELRMDDEPEWLEPMLLEFHDRHDDSMERDWELFVLHFRRAWSNIDSAELREGALEHAVMLAAELPPHPVLADRYKIRPPKRSTVVLLNTFVVLERIRLQADGHTRRPVYLSQSRMTDLLRLHHHSSVSDAIQHVFIPEQWLKLLSKGSMKRRKCNEYEVLIDPYPAEWNDGTCDSESADVA